MIAAYSTPGGRARVCPEFVGREDFLALGARRWSESMAGAGQLLVLAGEAGIGKSRLLDEMVAMIGPPRTVGVTAYPGDRETPGVVLLGLAGELRRAGEMEAADRIHSVVIAESPATDPVRRRRLLVAELTVALEDALAEPLLLRLEDAHWSDELSLDVLERVADALRHSPSMAIVTYRTDELSPHTDFEHWRTRLLAHRLAEEVRLSRLDADGTARMFASILGRPAGADELTRLLAASDGIPLHIEELVADGFERVPDTIAEAVIDRTLRLRPRTRETLDAAAVIGRSFDRELLSAVTGDGDDELEVMLSELIAEHFAVPRSDGRYDFRHALIRDAVYEEIGAVRRRVLQAAVARATDRAGFPDAAVSDHFERAGLAREAYTRALAAGGRAAGLSSHRDAAELFSRAERTIPAGATVADRADLHRRLAGELVATDDNLRAEAEFVRAIELLRSVGDEVGAAELVPALVAVRHLLGADLGSRMRDLDDAIARLDGAPGHAPSQARAQLLASLAAANMLDRRLAEARTYAEQASALFDPADAESRASVDATLGAVLVFAGQSSQGWALLESTVEVSRALGLEAVAARAHRMLGSCASVLLEYRRGSDWLSDGIAYTRAVERWNDAHYLTAHLAHVRWATGEWDDASLLASRALADGRSAITTRVTALHVLGYLALGRGEFDDARGILNEARQIGERMRELQRLSPALWGLAELALREGRFDDAVMLCETGFAGSDEVDDAAYLFPFVVTGARAYLAGGAAGAGPGGVGARGVHGAASSRSSVKDAAGRARDWVEKCSVLLRFRGIASTLPAIGHATGLVEIAAGRPAAARALLEDAAVGWEASGRWWEGTQALIDLAVCATRAKSPARAAALFTRATVLASSTRAIALLDQVAAASKGAARDEGTFPLSAREVEVARLVAAGSTNREIARSLTISPKTVGTHIEHILAKLGAARRTEIAAWSTEHPGH